MDNDSTSGELQSCKFSFDNPASKLIWGNYGYAWQLWQSLQLPLPTLCKSSHEGLLAHVRLPDMQQAIVERARSDQ